MCYRYEIVPLDMAISETIVWFLTILNFQTGEILTGVDGIMENGLWNFDLLEEQPSRYSYHSTSTAEHIQRHAEFGLTSNPASTSSRPPKILAHVVNRLVVLQVIVDMVLSFPHDKEKIFFSSLVSVNSIADRIFRKLRGLLMAVSLDSTKFELQEEENHNTVKNKLKEKQAATQRKKKGKNRNTKKCNPALKNCNDFVQDITLEVFFSYCCPCYLTFECRGKKNIF